MWGTTSYGVRAVARGRGVFTAGPQMPVVRRTALAGPWERRPLRMRIAEREEWGARRRRDPPDGAGC
jgi:hypothetical protein